MFLNYRTRIILAFAAIYIIWGTTYLAVRIGVQTLPPFMMGAMRYFIAGMAFLLYSRYKKEAVFTSSVRRNLLLGGIMQTGGQAIIFWAEQYISSGFAAILVATEPIWFILLDKPQWKFNFQNKFILIGVAVGFGGIIVLFQNLLAAPLVIQGEQNLGFVASIAAIGSCIVWAAGSLYFKYRRLPGSIQVNLGWQLIGGVITCLMVSGVKGEWISFTMATVSIDSWIAVLYLAIAGSIVAFASYNWLLTVRPASLVSTYAYINPVIAVIVGAILIHEKIVASQIVGMLIILVSAWLINKANIGVSDKK